MTATRPAPLFRTYDLSVETITPLHIGSGETLLRDFDFVVDGATCTVLDIDKVYGRLFDRLPDAQWEQIASLPLRRVMNSEGARDPQLARYPRMALASGVKGEGFEDVHACIRMPSGEAYLPGSSLKGAIRTAFATGYAAEMGDAWLRPFVQDIAERRTRREFAAQSIDQDIFGPRPNSDVLRAIRPSDLYVRTEFDPSDTHYDDLHVELVETRVTKKNGDSTATIMVEAFKAGTIFDGTLTVDADPVAHLNREQREQWEGLAADDALGAMQFLRDHAAALIDREKRHHAGSPIAAEYVALERRLLALDANSALAWVGWGTGWTAKTYGDLLTAEPAFADVAGQFRLGDPRTFPTTRRHAYANGKPHRPMGWVKVTITPRGER